MPKEKRGVGTQGCAPWLGSRRARRPESACALLTPGSDAPPLPWPESTPSWPDPPRSGLDRRPTVVPAALLADLHDPRLVLSDHYIGRDRRGVGLIDDPIDNSGVRTAPGVVAPGRFRREVPPLSAFAEPSSSLAISGLPEAGATPVVGRTIRRTAFRRLRDLLAILAIGAATVVPLALIGSHADGQALSAGNRQGTAAGALGARTRPAGGERAARARRVRATPARSAGRAAAHTGATHTAATHTAAVHKAAVQKATTQNAAIDKAAVRSQKAAARRPGRAARQAARAVLRTERRTAHAGHSGSHRAPKA